MITAVQNFSFSLYVTGILPGILLGFAQEDPKRTPRGRQV